MVYIFCAYIVAFICAFVVLGGVLAFKRDAFLTLLEEIKLFFKEKSKI